MGRVLSTFGQFTFSQLLYSAVQRVQFTFFMLGSVGDRLGGIFILLKVKLVSFARSICLHYLNYSALP